MDSIYVLPQKEFMQTLSQKNFHLLKKEAVLNRFSLTFFY